MIVNKYYSKKYLNVFLLLSFLVLIIIWISVVYLIGAQAIVTKIGLNNIYLPIFIIAILSGSSSFVSASFFAVYISIASGIDNHLLFVISGGLGLSVGDSIFYYLGKKGRKLETKKWQSIIEKLSSWFKKQSLYLVYLIIFIYNAFTPLPGDILNTILGLSGIKYRKIIIVIILGNITLLYLIAYFIGKNKIIIDLFY
ncbi:MAG TPA: VTT domain-containing protein [Patescibacteria group bacterium]|nr:VTT domain-containing protein [Patescibacteria group bacterium]